MEKNKEERREEKGETVIEETEGIRRGGKDDIAFLRFTR